MSAPAVAPTRPWVLPAALAGLGLVTVVATLVGGGNPAIALAPLAGLGFLYGLWRAPLRVSVTLLLFAGLALENPGENPAAGMWKSPLFPLGALLLSKLNDVTGIKPLRFTGVDAICGLLALVILYRKSRGDRSDRRGQTETASAMAFGASVTLGSVMLLWFMGLATHGDFQNSLWQVQKILYAPVLFFLFQAGFRGPGDHGLIGRVVVGAALVKAAEGFWVRYVLFRNLTKDELPHVNTHSDSMLYALAFTILLSAWVLRPCRRNAQRALLFLPLVGIGMVANTRRLVWVEVMAVLVTLFLMMPWNKVKRALARGVVCALPFVPIYLGLGWNSDSKIFKPVKMIVSVVNSKADRSTETRDVENFNLIWTLRRGPLLGTGFGHEYDEFVKGDDISKFFPQYRYIPHNSVLGLWAFGGALGFTGLWCCLYVAVFLAVRSFKRAVRPDDRIAAFCCVAMVVIFIAHGYGDMGIFSWPGAFLAAITLSVAGKLAVATGAWPARLRPAGVPA